MAPTRTSPPSRRSYRITVVCLGNICRSPMGESVLHARIADAGLTEVVMVDSAGTGTWHTGYGADERARATLTSHGYPDLPLHAARRITPSWFAEIDLVLAMDEHNYADLERLIGGSGASSELRMLRSFDPTLTHLPQPHPDLDVPDPYYGRSDRFNDVLHMIEHACEGVLDHVRTRIS